MNPVLGLLHSSTIVLSIYLLISLFYLGPNQFKCLKTICLPECLITGSKCDDLLLLHFYLQRLDDINVKNSWNSLRCKHQLKQIIKTREKNFATNENCILRKMALKFQDPNFNILCGITFWNKQKCLNKELIIWSGLSM